jgi:hypothetical protein
MVISSFGRQVLAGESTDGQPIVNELLDWN